MNTRRIALLAAQISLPLAACGLDPARIQDHSLLADDGGRHAVDGPVRFAVVGNTRPAVPALDRGALAHDGVTPAIVSDIAAHVNGDAGPGFVVLLGDTVRASAGAEWKQFDRSFAPLLEGATPAADGGKRVPGLPVVGDREAVGDGRYVGWEGAWPQVGADIGYNRVASWYAVDLETGGATWRMVVLDSGKERLGSRWREQLSWLEGALKSECDGILVFMHDPLLDLGGNDVDMNHGGGALELLDAMDEHLGMLKVRGVFGAGHHTSSAVLPDGPFGAIHIGAGGGGAPAEALKRWGPGDQADRNEDLQLEAMFDLALLGALDRRNDVAPLPEVVLDEAKARGSFEGFTGAYNPRHFPTYGWWGVELDGQEATLTFRLWAPDGALESIYDARFSPEKGWRGVRRKFVQKRVPIDDLEPLD